MTPDASNPTRDPTSRDSILALALPSREAVGRLTLGFSLISLAFRLLKRHRTRTLITLASLVFGQVMMVLTFGFTRNLHRMLPDQVCRAASGHVQVVHPDYLKTQKPGAFLAQPPTLAQLKALWPGIQGERPRIVTYGYLERDTDRQLIIARGVDPSREIEPMLVKGENIPKEAAGIPPFPVLLGVDAAASLRCDVGDRAVWNYLTADGTMDNVQCRIVGLVDEGIPERNRRAFVIHVDSARRMMELGAGCHEQQVFLTDDREVEAAARALRSGLGPKVAVVTWPEFNPMLRRTMRVMLSQTVVVTFIVVVVILFGVGSTISITSLERIREFGLLAVLGFGPRAVFGYVMAEGLVVGLATLATSTALSLALILTLGVYGIDLTPIAGERIVLDGVLIQMYMKPAPDLADFVRAGALVLGAAFLAAVVPAWQASRIRPSQALRTAG